MQDYQVKIYAELLENEALEQFYKAMALPCNVQGALMPDSHAGYTLPIGAVVKSKEKIFPSYVGYDVGCGMTAIRTSITDFTTEQLEAVREGILCVVPLGRDLQKKAQKIPQYSGASKVAKDVFKNLAPMQIGTLGGGNHFIELGTDSEGFVNVIIHSGSRGVGYKIAEHYMEMAVAEDVDKERYEAEFDRNNIDWFKAIAAGKTNSFDKYNKAKQEFVFKRSKARAKGSIEGHFGFNINTDMGKAYINDMNEALQFALDNRERMIDNIVKCMKEVFGDFETSRFINRNHNHAEVKDGYVIHRKGATHAELGMMGVIPGNMKDGSFIVKGKGNPESMCSSSHGAGRVLSRRKAKDTLSLDEFNETMSGIVTNHSCETLDEAPKAYKNIFEVMEQQSELVEVVDRVVPILNIKG